MSTAGEVRSHRDLIVWQKAMDLAVGIYRLSKQFPKSETYGLTSQITRAAASVPANIAEGGARGSAGDYSRFLRIAKGSLMETETYLLLATRLDYLTILDAAPILDLIKEVSKMLTSINAKIAV